MSDVSKASVASDDQAQKNTTSVPKVNPRDVEDIDRELEAYLEEKRTGKSMDFNNSVDEQLTGLRDKFKSRAKPATDTQSQLNNQPQTNAEPNKTDDASVQPDKEPKPAPQQANPSATSSHEDLIRSLEEKYSAGKETAKDNKVPVPSKPNRKPEEGKKNLQSEPTEQLAENKQPEEKAQKQGVQEKKDETKQKSENTPALNITTTELQDNIEGLDDLHAKALFSQLNQLSGEYQKVVVEEYLPRFRRNKERKELFERTQSSLEKELKAFIDKNSANSTPSTNQETSAKPLTIPQNPPQKPTPKKFDILDGQKGGGEKTHVFGKHSADKEIAKEPGGVPAQLAQETKTRDTEDADSSEELNKALIQSVEESSNPAESVDKKPQVKAPKEDVGGEKQQLQTEPKKTESVTQPPRAVDAKPSQEVTEEQEGDKKPKQGQVEVIGSDKKEEESADAIIERYKTYLANLKNKPSVLVYDPQKGFVRKDVDPNDSTLTLSYSFDKSSDEVAATVFDKDGNELGVIKTHRSELKA